jgi:hypothetical protein
MRPGLANANGRMVRALQARLGLPGGIEAAAGLLPDPEAPFDTPPGLPLLVIEDLHETPWASLTFSGTRHHLELRLDGHAQAVAEAADTLSCWAEDADPLPGGHFLAEVQVTETAREVGEGGRMSLCLRLNALTIEE